MKEVERLVLSRRLAHDGSPVMRWCLSNVAIDQDAAGNVEPSKARSRDGVDRVTALAMAVGVAATEGRHMSVYAERPRSSSWEPGGGENRHLLAVSGSA